MNVSTCPKPSELKELSLGLLPASQSDSLFEHVGECEQCQQTLETLSDQDDSLVMDLRNVDSSDDSEDSPQFRMAIARALELAPSSSDAQPASEQRTAALPELRLPEMVGEYKILGAIGKGGMGNVYKAQHTKLGREVALKVLAARRLANLKSKQRFESEMLAIGKLSHPNIVTAHDAREVEGTAVLVMEFIDGVDLEELLRRVGPLTVADACEITQKIAAALEYVSQSGFVHRDIKPSNIMLNREGDAKLLDLGLARLTQVESDVTATGFVMGTADYVSPEQIQDCRDVDIRSDLYSLGCTLFKLLSGQAPFAGPETATVFAKMTAHNSAQPPRLDSLRADVPKALCNLIDSLLSKSPDQRPQNPSEVAQQLRQFSQGSQLPELVTKAIATPAPEPQSSAQTKVRTATAQAAPWYKKRFGLGAAMAAGIIGLLLGIYCGVIITIKYPDGTLVKLIAPEGSEVEVHQDDDQEAKAKGPKTSPQGSTSSPPPAQRPAGVPFPNLRSPSSVTRNPAQELFKTLQGEWVFQVANINGSEVEQSYGKEEPLFTLEGYSYQATLDKAIGKAVFGSKGTLGLQYSASGKMTLLMTPESEKQQELELRIEGQYIKLSGTAKDAFVEIELKKKADEASSPSNLQIKSRLPNKDSWKEFFERGLQGQHVLESAIFFYDTISLGNKKPVLTIDGNHYVSNLDKALGRKLLGESGTVAVTRSKTGDQWSIQMTPIFGNVQRFKIQVLSNGNYAFVSGNSIRLDWKKRTESPNSAAREPAKRGVPGFEAANQLVRTLQGSWNIQSAVVNGDSRTVDGNSSLTIAGHTYKSSFNYDLGKKLFGDEGQLGIQHANGATTLFVTPSSGESLSLDLQIDFDSPQSMKLSGITKDAAIEIQLKKREKALDDDDGENRITAPAQPAKDLPKPEPVHLSNLKGSWVLVSGYVGGEPIDTSSDAIAIEFNGYSEYESNTDSLLQSQLFGERGRCKFSKEAENYVMEIEPESGKKVTLGVRLDGRELQIYGSHNGVCLLQLAKSTDKVTATSNSAQFYDTYRAQQQLSEQSEANLKTLHKALGNFSDAYRKYPGPRNVLEGSAGPRSPKMYPFSWRIAILPFIGENELFQRYKFNQPWNSPENLELLADMPEIFRSPHAERSQVFGLANYASVDDPRSVMGAADGTSLDQLNEAVNSLLLLETKVAIPWTKPQDVKPRKLMQSGRHTNEKIFSYISCGGLVHDGSDIEPGNFLEMVARFHKESAARNSETTEKMLNAIQGTWHLASYLSSQELAALPAPPRLEIKNDSYESTLDSILGMQIFGDSGKIAMSTIGDTFAWFISERQQPRTAADWILSIKAGKLCLIGRDNLIVLELEKQDTKSDSGADLGEVGKLTNSEVAMRHLLDGLEQSSKSLRSIDQTLPGLDGNWKVVTYGKDETSPPPKSKAILEIAGSHYSTWEEPRIPAIFGRLGSVGKLRAEVSAEGQVHLCFDSETNSKCFHVKLDKDTLTLADPKSMQPAMKLERSTKAR